MSLTPVTLLKVQAIEDAGFGADLVSSGNDVQDLLNVVPKKLAVNPRCTRQACMFLLEEEKLSGNMRFRCMEPVFLELPIFGSYIFILIGASDASSLWTLVRLQGSQYAHRRDAFKTDSLHTSAVHCWPEVIGCTMNENGCFLVEATHVGLETAMSQIVQLLEAAQLARVPVQKFADQISKFLCSNRTLTVGKPVVVNAVLFSNYSMEEFCAVSIATEIGAYVSNLY
ncbi:hypothetical protein C1H46_000432 [Malus baccata]|uniref:Uncharacterized protein n=1 Tax=Malus baccata TaxID=106549 RepID=A0A540NTX9_MALBA|nr:hypothetical protein C1H46_000432 [Malus baccata]